MSTTKQISDNSYALHLDDGRVFTLSNKRGDDMNDYSLLEKLKIN